MLSALLSRTCRRTDLHVSKRAKPPDDQGFAGWQIQDSNLGRHKPTDLQSAPIGRSGNLPCLTPRRLAMRSGGRKNSKGRPPTRNHQEGSEMADSSFDIVS